MTSVQLEKELKKRIVFPYYWGRKQSDKWDQQTSFIYHTFEFLDLQKKISNLSEEIQYYAMNRWYNYWSAMAVEKLFCQHTNVTAQHNKYDKLIDFRIQGIAFDHKTSIFPKAFGKTISYAVKHKEELLQWLYKNQSQQGRKHLANRLFIVVCDQENSEHWKLKAEISLLKLMIDRYIKSFSMNKLYTFDPGNGMVYSDIIWLIR